MFDEYLFNLLRFHQDFNIGILKFFFSQISESHVSQIFNTRINFMYGVFAPQIEWPSQQKIQKYMPKSFKVSFPNTRVNIDYTTEIVIQKPQSLTAQRQTYLYSNCKHYNTFKAIVGKYPSGTISFESEFLVSKCIRQVYYSKQFLSWHNFTK